MILEYDSILVFALRGSITGLDPAPPYKNAMPAILIKQANITAIDVDPILEEIYWLDAKSNTIQRSFANGSRLEIILDGGPEKLNCFAVDPISRLIYFGSYFEGTNMGFISVAALNGAHRLRLMDGIKRPNSLILHPRLG